MFYFPQWDVEAETGYVPQTTFWNDFCIADVIGENSIRDTFDRAFNNNQNNVIYFTELVLVLNHKMWYFFEKKQMAFAQLYNELFEKANNWAVRNLKGKELEYFYRTVG